jgi:hypothetical protein
LTPQFFYNPTISGVEKKFRAGKKKKITNFFLFYCLTWDPGASTTDEQTSKSKHRHRERRKSKNEEESKEDSEGVGAEEGKEDNSELAPRIMKRSTTQPSLSEVVEAPDEQLSSLSGPVCRKAFRGPNLILPLEKKESASPSPSGRSRKLPPRPLVPPEPAKLLLWCLGSALVELHKEGVASHPSSSSVLLLPNGCVKLLPRCVEFQKFKKKNSRTGKKTFFGFRRKIIMRGGQ